MSIEFSLSFSFSSEWDENHARMAKCYKLQSQRTVSSVQVYWICSTCFEDIIDMRRTIPKWFLFIPLRLFKFMGMYRRHHHQHCRQYHHHHHHLCMILDFWCVYTHKYFFLKSQKWNWLRARTYKKRIYLFLCVPM